MSGDDEKQVPLGQLTDEQILGMDPDTLPETAEEAAAQAESQDNDSAAEGQSSAKDQSAADDSEQDTGSDEGGASDDADSSDDEDGGADSASDDDGDDLDDQDSGADDDDDSAEDDQSSDDSDDSDDDDQGQDDQSDADSEIDHATEYKRLLEPFKAARRTIQVRNVDEARRLMQQGVDYSNKMAQMKPSLRVLRTLDKNDLNDPDKINFLIDLSRGDPAAVRKLLKDNNLDPTSLSLEEDSEDYSPNDHSVSEVEMNIQEILDSISGSEHFDRTVEVVTKEMDMDSRVKLRDNPSTIAMLHEHIALGIYEKVMDRVASGRLLGTVRTGLSDLDAYDQVGEAMFKAGEFAPDGASSSTARKTGQDSAQDSGKSGRRKKSGTRDRRRAAGRTKDRTSGKQSKGPNLAEMSDEEILNIDPRTLDKL